jgi:hypothetical protein
LCFIANLQWCERIFASAETNGITFVPELESAMERTAAPAAAMSARSMTCVVFVIDSGKTTAAAVAQQVLDYLALIFQAHAGERLLDALIVSGSAQTLVRTARLTATLAAPESGWIDLGTHGLPPHHGCATH